MIFILRDSDGYNKIYVVDSDNANEAVAKVKQKTDANAFVIGTVSVREVLTITIKGNTILSTI